MLVRWPRREEKLQGAGVGKRGKGVGGQHSGGGGGGCTRTISSAEVFLQCLPDELQSWESALPVHIQYHKYKFPLLCTVKINSTMFFHFKLAECPRDTHLSLRGDRVLKAW